VSPGATADGSGTTIKTTFGEPCKSCSWKTVEPIVTVIAPLETQLRRTKTNLKIKEKEISSLKNQLWREKKSHKNTKSKLSKANRQIKTRTKEQKRLSALKKELSMTEQNFAVSEKRINLLYAENGKLNRELKKVSLEKGMFEEAMERVINQFEVYREEYPESLKSERYVFGITLFFLGMTLYFLMTKMFSRNVSFEKKESFLKEKLKQERKITELETKIAAQQQEREKYLHVIKDMSRKATAS